MLEVLGIILLGLLQGATTSAGELRAVGLKHCYVTSTEKIEFEVKNLSDHELYCSVAVEKLEGSEWMEYCTDIFQERPYPMAVMAASIESHGSRVFTWEPKKTGNFYELRNGRYRIRLYVGRKGGEGRHIVAGEFVVVESASECEALPGESEGAP